MTSLSTGDAAPDFTGVTTDGTHVSLADFRGRKLVLYFYPKDDTLKEVFGGKKQVSMFEMTKLVAKHLK